MTSPDATPQEPTKPRSFLNYLIAGLSIGLGTFALWAGVWLMDFVTDEARYGPRERGRLLEIAIVVPLSMLLAMGATALARWSRFNALLGALTIMFGLQGVWMASRFLDEPHSYRLLPGLGPLQHYSISVPFMFCAMIAILVGRSKHFRPGYWSGFIGIAALLFAWSPRLIKERVNPRNRSAAGDLREIYQREALYEEMYGTGFSPTLSSMGPPEESLFKRSVESASAAALVHRDLASGEIDVYKFTYRPAPPDRSGKIIHYTIVARPLKFQGNGGEAPNSYFTDETGVIRVTREDREATATDPPIAE